MIKVRNNSFNNSWYNPGRVKFILILWYLTNILIFKNPLMVSYAIKINILRLFGAVVGDNVIIKPNVNIKYPWFLNIGNNSWIGEGVWIDNLCQISIGSNVCVSQGAMLLTGNHDYKKSTFDLFVGEVILEDGVWVGAKSIVCPGVTAKSHSVLSVGSVASSDLMSYKIYKGNPAEPVKTRTILS